MTERTGGVGSWRYTWVTSGIGAAALLGSQLPALQHSPNHVDAMLFMVGLIFLKWGFWTSLIVHIVLLRRRAAVRLAVWEHIAFVLAYVLPILLIASVIFMKMLAHGAFEAG